MNESRRAALRRTLGALGADGAALTAGPSLQYFTGWDVQATEHMTTYLIPASGGGDACVVTGLDQPSAEADLGGRARVFAYRRGDVEATFHAALQAAGLAGKRLAVERLRLRGCEEDALRGGGSGELVAGDQPLAACRQVKDAGELASLRRAAALGEEAFRAVLPRIRAGVTEDEVALRLEAAILERGGHLGPKRAAVLTGARSAYPHGQPGAVPLRPGDLVIIDFSARVDGYLCDITRTLAVGEIDPSWAPTAAAVLAANRAGVAAVRPGESCQAPELAVRGVLGPAGLEAAFLHSTGHGIGLDLHEGPSLSRASRDTLAPGMVVTVEPGVYLPGRGGIRIEDDVIVTETGAEVLTTLPRELIQVPGA
ncbi:MAG TPA: Xaa-Pro peptidase family protein [Bacillota bacterium]|nr:Xaa-Pro peptidase family protein [Bacillota bacterium]